MDAETRAAEELEKRRKGKTQQEARIKEMQAEKKANKEDTVIHESREVRKGELTSSTA